jgi:hypothetical protein
LIYILDYTKIFNETNNININNNNRSNNYNNYNKYYNNNRNNITSIRSNNNTPTVQYNDVLNTVKQAKLSKEQLHKLIVDLTKEEEEKEV